MARGGRPIIPTGGTAQRIQDQRNRSTHSIPLDKLIPYHRENVNGNPIFHDYAQDKLEQLANSLERDGQVENIIVFPSEQQPGMYEVLSGKQRTRAARLVQQKHPERNTLNATVLDLQAVKANTFALGDLTYVLTNVHRRDQLLISELGMAFEMQFQAEKHQGKAAAQGTDTLTELAQQNQTSPSFIKCARQFIPEIAIPEIIDLADSGSIPVSTASQTLTRMNKETQRALIEKLKQASEQEGWQLSSYCRKKLTTAALRALKAAYDIRIAAAEDAQSNVLTEDDTAFLFTDAKPKTVFKAPTKQALQRVIPEQLWGDQKAASDYLVNAMEELKRYKEKYGEL